MEPTSNVNLNQILNSQAIKQPKPDLNGKKEAQMPAQAPENAPQDKKKKREYNRPNVGVVDAPKISSTPMQDTITLKKQENPHTVYKLTPKSLKNFNFHKTLSILIGGCGLVSILSLLKGKKVK